ncbi:MAG TPA: hypothetical protein VGH38_35110 [Bryobacteraceae bacterium]
MGAGSAQDPEAIRRQLQRVLVSPVFLHSERLRRFLTHCVEAALSGRVEDLKEYTIALVAFDRPKHYNPADDPIVRVEARRLRKKLDEYYLLHGAADPVIIQLPKGGYLPLFELRQSEVPTKTPLAPPPRGQRTWPWAVAGAALVCTAALAFWWIGHPNPLPALTLTRVTSNRGLTSDPQLTPDGAWLVYASDRSGGGGLDIWLQNLNPGSPGGARQLTSDPADDSQPAISPDTSTVAFRSERQPPGIYTVPASGGTATLLVPDGRNPRYSPDGAWLAYWVGSPGGEGLPPAGKAFIIRPSGGAPHPLLGNFASSACPVWSPGGRTLLVEAIEKTGDPLDLWSASVDDRPPVPTGAGQAIERSHLKFSLRECSFSWGKDSLMFSALEGDTQNLWRLAATAGGRPLGGAVRATLGSGEEALPFAAASGEIAFVGRSETVDVWRMPLDHPERLERVTEGVPSATFPSVARDRLAYLTQTQGHTDVWLKDLKTGHATQLTHAPIDPRYPQLCPDGETVAFSSGPNAFSTKAGAPSDSLVCNGCARVWQCGQESLLYLPAGSTSPKPIHQFPLPSGPGSPLLTSLRFDLAGAQKSADGWLAFHAINGLAQRQIFVAPDGPGVAASDWTAVTDGLHLDRNAVWNERSDTLYFISERCGFRCIWMQRLDRATKRPVGEPAPVRHFHSARQSLSAIGDVGAIGPAYMGGDLFFALAEQAGDIWLAKPVTSVKSLNLHE